MKTIGVNLAFISSQKLSGPGYYAVQLFEHLVRLDRRDVRLLAFVPADALPHFSVRATAHVVKLPVLGGRVTRVLYEQLLLPVIAHRHRVDLLFSPSFVSPLWGAKRKVVTICDMYYRAIPELLDRFQRKYWSVMVPISAKACDGIISISQHTQCDIEKYIPSVRGKIETVPLASRFDPDGTCPLLLSPDRAMVPFVLMVANLTPNKNPQVVVRALSLLRSQGVDVRLVHVGSDPSGLLRESIANHDADEIVDCLGKVDDCRLTQLYRGCLATVTPSTYEGFGMPAVEAQAMGAPLISSNRTALPEAAGESALYFNPTDASELAQRILEVMRLSPAEREDLVQRGRRSAARFSWARTATETFAVFDTVLAQ